MHTAAIDRDRVRGKRRSLIVGLAAAAAAAAASVASAPPAFAHAIVKETRPGIDEVVPTSPESVVMRFNEPVELSFGAIRVFDTQGGRVDAGAADHVPASPDAVHVPLRPGLAKGTYTVTWRVVSADGHPIAEAFVFHVREPGENPRGIADRILAGGSPAGRLPHVLFGAARWLNFVGLIVLGGAFAFALAVWRWGRTTPPAATAVRIGPRLSTVMAVSWTLIVIATAAGFVLQGSVAGELPLGEAIAPDILGEVAATRYGRVALLKLGVLALLGGGWALCGRRAVADAGAGTVGAERAGAQPARWLVLSAGAAVVVLLATPGLSGHAGTTSPVPLNVAADTLHLVAAAVWLGGLASLAVAAFGAARPLPQAEAATWMTPLVARFSDVAVAAVAVVVVTGTYRAWLEVGALRALTNATYGWVLLAKLAVFAPLLALGAVNNRWIKRRIEAAVSAGDPGAAPMATLRRLVAAEVALGAAVLAVTALLVNLPPAKVEAGIVGPFIEDVRIGTHNLNVLVDPNRVGENEVHLTARTPEGAPAPIKEMRVLFRMPDEGIGPIVGRGVELATGHFVVQGRHLSVAGEWRLEIVARLGRFEEERTDVSVIVN